MKLGPESEFTIFNSNGTLMNDAYKILKTLSANDAYAPWRDHVCPEASKVLIETGCPPSESLDEIVQSYTAVLDVLVRAAEERQLLIAPVSTFVQDTDIEVAESERIHWVLPAIGAGPGQRPPGLQLVSTQVHIDLEHTDHERYLQFTLGTALDATFAFMAHSCFYDGVHKGNDMRVPNFRFNAHFPFLELGGLVPYQRNFAALKRYFEHNQHLWRQRLTYLDESPDLPATKIEGPFGFTWGHPRFTLKGEKQTLEMRSADANIPSNCFAYFALMKGAFLALRDVKLQTASENSPRDRFFTVQSNHHKDRLILPPFNYVQFLVSAAYNYGISGHPQGNQVRAYLTRVVAFAKRGLPQEEHHYLEPFETMLDVRENWSDELLRYARRERLVQHDALVPDGAKQLRLYANDVFMKDIQKWKERVAAR